MFLCPLKLLSLIHATNSLRMVSGYCVCSGRCCNKCGVLLIYLLHVNLIILEECKCAGTDLGKREGTFPSYPVIPLDSHLLFSLLPHSSPSRSPVTPSAYLWIFFTAYGVGGSFLEMNETNIC